MIVVLVVVISLFLLALGLNLFLIIGKWCLLIPLAIVALWIIGHLWTNSTYWTPGKWDRCPGCRDYTYKNVFTEWWHKRKCLPLIVKNV